MSWVVEGPAFVYEENRTSESMIFDAATRAWISGMSYEERAEFVDTLFGLLEEADIKILGDFTATKRQKLKDLFRLTRENAEGKQILKTAGKALLTEATKAVSKIITGK
jgi:hypothetical protein